MATGGSDVKQQYRAAGTEPKPWSAVLRHTAVPGLGGVQRHLPGQVVPAPPIVARFVIELDQDANTIWATAAAHHPLPLDRRHLAMELDGYAYP